VKLRHVRSMLYKAARVLGDVGAVTGGPKKVAKRVVNKLLGRAVVRRLWWR